MLGYAMNAGYADVAAYSLNAVDVAVQGTNYANFVGLQATNMVKTLIEHEEDSTVVYFPDGSVVDN